MHIDNSRQESQIMDEIRNLIGELPSKVFISPIPLLGGGGKYGYSIIGIKGVAVSGYITVPSQTYRRGWHTTKDIKITKRILVDKDMNLSIDKIKQAVLELKEQL